MSTFTKLTEDRSGRVKNFMNGKTNFYCDYFTYVCVERNSRLALDAIKKSNIEIGYGREGWLMLLAHYYDVLLEMQSIDYESIMDKAYIKKIKAINDTFKLNIVQTIYVVEHTNTMIISDTMLLNEVILAAAYIKNLLKRYYNVHTTQRQLTKDIKRLNKS